MTILCPLQPLVELVIHSVLLDKGRELEPKPLPQPSFRHPDSPAEGRPVGDPLALLVLLDPRAQDLALQVDPVLERIHVRLLRVLVLFPQHHGQSRLAEPDLLRQHLLLHARALEELSHRLENLLWEIVLCVVHLVCSKLMGTRRCKEKKIDR